MASFPRLKTNAVTQYPSRRTLAFRNQAVRFVDGREQRYRDSASPLRRWVVDLAQLDEDELARIEQFFEDQRGMFGSFEFTDPADGRVYTNCSLGSDELEAVRIGEMNGATRLEIQENR